MIRTLLRTWNRLLGSVFGQRHESDLAEELESHILLLAEENVRRGIPPAEAHRLARIQFGSVESAKESYREQRGLPLLDALGQDLRYAFRGIRKSPGFASVAILSLAVGIGANTAIFSMVNAVILRPLAFAEPERLFGIRELLPHLFGTESIPVSPAHAYEWAKECPSIERVALIRNRMGDLTSGGEPASVTGADVSHNLFALLGVEPRLGRTFLAEEERGGNHRVVILSEALWRSRFHGDSAVVGKPVLIDGQNHQVVGVMPAWFHLPYRNGANTQFEIFRPLVFAANELGRPMGNFNYGAVVRLKRGVTAARALAEIDVVQARFPARAGSTAVLKAALTPVHQLITGRAGLGLWMLTAAVGAVLLIVCINLANLLLSRMATRSREAAIRTALGASRGRQVRMVLTEAMLLAACGGALGILFAAVSMQFLVAMTTLEIPRLDEVRLDSSALAFALLVTVVTGLVFGILPALRLAGKDPQLALRAGSHTVTEGRSGLRVSEGLISLEVGLSAALLIIAGLLGGSLTRLLNVEKGFDAAQLLTVDVGLSGNLYKEADNRERFYERLLAKVAAIPGVQASGFITNLPTRGETWLDPIYLAGDGRRESEHHSVNNRFASPEYFRAMGISVRQGRGFEEGDRGRSVAVLSQKAAKLLWPGESNPVGLQFVGEDDKPKTLVGVVGEVRAELHRDPPPMAYYPYWQRVPGGGSLVVRTSGDPRATAGGLRAALRSVDPQLPIRAIHTMEEEVDRSVAERRFQLVLMAVFAASALLVASLGIYGVVAYAVTRRRSEIGIRLALGASRFQVLWMVVRQGMIPVVAGLALGVAVSLLGGGALRALLFEVQPTDFLTILGVSSVLFAVGLLACLIPARRAVSSDPLSALRAD